MVSRASLAQQARRVLDRRYQQGSVEALEARPRGGWLRAVRNGLGMTQHELARRLDVTQASIAALEASERSETLTLGKLRRAAEAMDCRLVYAIVPTTTLDDVVQRRAEMVVSERERYVQTTMALEAQRLTADQQEAAHAQRVAEAVDTGGLWG